MKETQQPEDVKPLFTPGPWSVEASMESDRLHTIWADDAHDSGVGILIARTCFAPSSEANAQLIASAPTLAAEIERLRAEKAELVEALNGIAKLYDDNLSLYDLSLRFFEAKEIAGEAIAKATATKEGQQ